MPNLDRRLAAVLVVGSAGVAFAAVYATWLTVSITGANAPGSSQSGWDGRDGITIAVTAVCAVLGGVALLVGRRETWLPPVLVLAGALTVVIAIVNVAGAQGKADDINRRYDIAAADVAAHVGPGVWLVAVAGVGILAGGLLAHRFRHG